MNQIFGMMIICALTSFANAQTLRHFDYPIDHSMSLDELIAELGDDGVLWNAQTAIKAIMSYPNSPIDRLYEALDDPDGQIRQIACDLLWNIRGFEGITSKHNDMVYTTYRRWIPNANDPNCPAWRFTKKPEVTPRLVAVTTEGFKDDGTPYDRSLEPRRALMYTDAIHGLYRLAPIAQDWQAELEAAAQSKDSQQRFFAALTLAIGGVEDSIEIALAELLPHLRDNDTEGDAVICIWAIAQFGKPVIPHLAKVFPSADQQQRELITLIILDLTNPPQTKQELIARKEMHSITNIVYDPVLEPTSTYLRENLRWTWQLP
jgi:hypothetical protein